MIDLLPGIALTEQIHRRRRNGDRSSVKTVISTFLPRRLVDRWLDLNALHIEQLEESMHAWQVRPSGTEGYSKAEVTAGGVDTKDLSSKTMEAKREPGLYFIGEVVDVTGHLGGYNFQWAWASAFAAGQVV
jgi:predicted flavoprotein YhiN